MTQAAIVKPSFTCLRLADINSAPPAAVKQEDPESSSLWSTSALTSARERDLQADSQRQRDLLRAQAEEDKRTRQSRRQGDAVTVKMEPTIQPVNILPARTMEEHKPATPRRQQVKPDPSPSKPTTTPAPALAPGCLNCKAKIKIRCEKCRGVGYCRQSCLDIDADRHAQFCVGGILHGRQDRGPDMWLESGSSTPEPEPASAAAGSAREQTVPFESESEDSSSMASDDGREPSFMHSFSESFSGSFMGPFAGPLATPWWADDDYDVPGMPDTWQTDTEKIIEHLANLPDIDVPPERRPKTPKALNCELQPHQRVGLDWLMRMEDGPHRGSILADTMGLGKTIQALSLILEHPSKDPAQKTTLIVAPVSLQKQWKTEIEDKIKPGHKLKTVIIDGIKRKTMSLASLLSHDVVLTSYGTIRSEYSPRKGASTRRLMTSALFHRIILDEAHNIKNDKSQTAVAINSLRARYRLCLTATPLMNRVRELYSLVRFLRVDPYTEWSVFNNTFIRGWTNGEAGVVDQDAGMRALRLFLPSVLLQRKAESLIDGAPVLRLPPLELKTSNLVFDPEQRLEYAAVEKRMQDKFNKLVQQRIARKKYCTILVMILRLRQFCCHPHLISDHGIPDGAELKPREMISLALKLDHTVVERIKKLDVLECTLCNEVKENPLIISPCGHLLCGDCFAGFVFFRDAEQFGAFGEEDQQDFTSCPCNACDENVEPRKVLCYNFFATAYGLATDTSNAFNELMEEEAASDASDASDADENGNLKGFVAPDGIESTDSEEETQQDGSAQASSSAMVPSKRSKDRDFDSDSDDSLPELGVMLQRKKPGVLPFKKRAVASPASSTLNTTATQNDANVFIKREGFFDRHMEDLAAAKNKKLKTTNVHERDRLLRQAARQELSAAPRNAQSDDDIQDETQEASLKRKRFKGKDIAKPQEQASKQSPAPSNKKEKMQKALTLAHIKVEGNKNAAAKEKYMEVLKQEYEPSVKTDEVLELLSDIRKNKPTEKTLVFSVFTSFLDILEVPVKEEGYVYRRYDGSMGRLAREKAVHDFMKRPEVKVMLIGLQAGNAGLNLQAASQVIILDPFWNPSIEDQAVGRAHRFPQRRPVTVHRILIDDTIENRIIDLQNSKRALVGQVLSNENRQGASHLTIGEMATLLGIRSGGPRGPRGARGAIGVGGLGGPGGQRRRRD